MKRLAVLLLSLALAAAKAAPEPATILSGGQIITMDGASPETVEAIAVRGGKIIAVGTITSVAKAAGKHARRIDLKGSTLLPGFIDAHGHVSFVGQNAGMVQLQPPPVGGVDSIAKLQQAFRDWTLAQALPEGVPVVGNGFDDSQLVERRFPNRQNAGWRA